jgi:hypothetical protein
MFYSQFCRYCIKATHHTTFLTFFQFYIRVAYQTHESHHTSPSWSPCRAPYQTMHEESHTSRLITSTCTTSNKHESLHSSRNWSPCRATHSTNMNHITLRLPDHLVEHHIKQCMKNHTLRVWSPRHATHPISMNHNTLLRATESTISNKHEESHTSRNWSPGFIVHKWWFNGYKSRFSKINRKSSIRLPIHQNMVNFTKISITLMIKDVQFPEFLVELEEQWKHAWLNHQNLTKRPKSNLGLFSTKLSHNINLESLKKP